MEFIRFITISNLILVAGIVLFTSWLLRTSLGKNALIDSVPRRNDMPIYLPFIVLFLALQFVPVGLRRQSDTGGGLAITSVPVHSEVGGEESSSDSIGFVPLWCTIPDGVAEEDELFEGVSPGIIRFWRRSLRKRGPLRHLCPCILDHA